MSSVVISVYRRGARSAFASLCKVKRSLSSSTSNINNSNQHSNSNSNSSIEGSGSGRSKSYRVLSGLQPTGSIHLGNYLGAIRQWKNLQEVESYENYYCVVDQHAITTYQDPKKLAEHTLNSAAMYIACGIDPKKSTIFIQSHVRAHTELAWYLTCNTPLSWLNRMVQFKEKSSKGGADSVSLGLFAYPVLMAADILLYDSHYVPVGEDQTQHIELTRDICQHFNTLYGKRVKDRKSKKEVIEPVLVEPSILLMKNCARVMSLQDGTSKMSKSTENDNSRINLLDPPDLIAKKIKQCKSDSIVGITLDESRPESRNLMQLYLALNGVDGVPSSSNNEAGDSSGLETDKNNQIVAELASMSWGSFKPRLTEALVEHIKPIQDSYHKVSGDRSYLLGVLNKGKERAEATAETTLKRAKNAMGIYSS